MSKDRKTGLILLFTIAVILTTAELSSLVFAQEEAWVISKKKEETAGFDFTAYTTDSEIKFSLPSGETIKLDKPVFKKDDTIWIPLESFLPKMNLIFIKQAEDAFTIIRDDGTPVEFKVNVATGTVNKMPFITMAQAPAVSSGIFYMTLSDLAKTLDVSFNYDKATDTVEFMKAKVEEFSTFSLPTPPPTKEETLALIVPKPLPPPDVVEELLPPQYEKIVDLQVDMTLSYLEDKFAHDRTRQADWYLSGRIYDFTADGHLRMNDVRTTDKQRFKEDGEYVALYRKDIQLKALDNYLALPQLRSQTQPYFGGEATLVYNPFKSTFIFGETDNTVSGPSDIGAVRYFGNMYYFRQEYTDSHNIFNVSGAVIWHQAHAETQGKSGTTNYPRRNFVMLLDSTVHLYPSLDVFYTQAISNYAPDNYVNKRFIDGDWRVGVAFDEKLYNFKMSYERVGQQYASIGIPSNYQDFEQLDYSTSFKFAPNWYGGLTGRINRNNIERNPRKPTAHENSLTVNTGLILPWQQNVNFSYTLTESKNLGGDQDINGNRYKDFRIDYTKTMNNTTVQMSYDHYILDAFGTSTGGLFTDMFSATVFQYFPQFNYSYLRVYQDVRQTKTFTPASYTTTYWNTDLGARWNITNFLSGSIDWRVATTQREAFQDTAMMTLLTGFEYKSSAVTTWNFDYNLSDFDLYDSKNQTTKHYTLMFKLRHVFDLESPDLWGKVVAFVYDDLNANGRFDKGETPLKNVRVNIVKGRAAYTNTKGIAYIYKVTPGERKIKVDLSNMPLDMAVMGDSSVKSVSVRSLHSTSVEFPIVSTGKIKGRVYIDMNKNGVYDKLEDEGIANVRIYLAPDGKETLTYSDGTYNVDYVFPGAQEVNVDIGSVAEDYKISSPAKVKLDVKGKETYSDIDFAFSPAPIEVERFDKE